MKIDRITKIVIAVVVLLALLYTPSAIESIRLQVAYHNHPDRLQAALWENQLFPDRYLFGIGHDGKVARAIVLHQTNKLTTYFNNHYPYNTRVIPLKGPGGDFFELSMHWQCHECFDLILNKVGTPTIQTLNQTIYQQDSYYFDQVIERVGDVNTDEMTPPLRAAIGSNKYVMVVKLVQKGADINQVYAEQSMLALAIEEKDQRIIDFLKSNGAK